MTKIRKKELDCLFLEKILREVLIIFIEALTLTF